MTDPGWTPKPVSFGVEPHEIVKRHDPETSLDAAQKIDIDAQIWAVLRVIRAVAGTRSRGGPGVTGDELQHLFGVQDQREKPVSYSSILGHIVTLERQCYVERPQVKREGIRFKNDQLVIWALTDDEREAKLAEIAGGLNRQPTPEVFDLIGRMLPLQEQLRLITEQLTEIEDQLLDYYLPERPLGTRKAFLGKFTEDERLREYFLSIDIKRYSRVLKVTRKPR